MRFNRILTNYNSKRAYNRVLNQLLANLYSYANRNVTGRESRWVLGRAIVEIGWPECPSHSGVDWEQLPKHYGEMMRAEKTALIRDNILPLLLEKSSPAAVVVEARIPADQVDQVDYEKAAIDHLKQLVEDGKITNDDAVQMAKAQRHLMNRQSQE